MTNHKLAVALLALSAAASLLAAGCGGQPARAADLEVTYYFLPG
jgi:hypothetical protein